MPYYVLCCSFLNENLTFEAAHDTQAKLKAELIVDEKSISVADRAELYRVEQGRLEQIASWKSL